MVRKDVGVVLKTVRSGESSKLITFLGCDSGKINLLGKGALSPRSPFRGALELGNVIEVVYYHKEGRTLFFLKEVCVRSTLGRARESLAHLSCAMGLMELVERVCYWGSPEKRIVDLVEEFLGDPLADDPLHTYLVLEFKILEILGVVPDFSGCPTCGAGIVDGHYLPAEGTSFCKRHSPASPHRVLLDATLLEYIATVARSTLDEASRIEVTAACRKRFGQILHWTYTFHIEGYRLPEALKLIQKRR